MWVLQLITLLEIGNGCTPSSSKPEQQVSTQLTKKPQRLHLDKGLKQVIGAYEKRWHSSRLYCLEYEKIAYDSVQMSLYPAGEYIPIVDLCRPNFYAEFDDKLILIATGVEFITPGASYRNTHREAFYRVVTEKILGKAYTQYDSLGLTYGNYDPAVWRVIVSEPDKQSHRVYSVTDSFAVRTRNQPPTPILFTPTNPQTLNH